MHTIWNVYRIWTHEMDTWDGHTRYPHAWTHEMPTCDGHMRWTHEMGTRDGHTRWTHEMDTCDGHEIDTLDAHMTCPHAMDTWTHEMDTRDRDAHMICPHTMDTCDGHMRWTHAMDTCDEHMRWTHEMPTCDAHMRCPHAMDTRDGHMRDGHTRWTHAIDTCDGHMRCPHAMDTCDGHMRCPHAMDTCDGHMRWTHALDTCDGHMRWTHAMDTCDAHMRCPHAMDTCVGHMRWTHAMDTCDGHARTAADQHLIDPPHWSSLLRCWSLCISQERTSGIVYTASASLSGIAPDAAYTMHLLRLQIVLQQPVAAAAAYNIRTRAAIISDIAYTRFLRCHWPHRPNRLPPLVMGSFRIALLLRLSLLTLSRGLFGCLLARHLHHFVVFIVSLCTLCGVHSSPEVIHNVSLTIERLLDNYDMRLRPQFGGRPRSTVYIKFLTFQHNILLQDITTIVTVYMFKSNQITNGLLQQKIYYNLEIAKI